MAQSRFHPSSVKKFDPTPRFLAVADAIDVNDLDGNAPEVAAGVLTYYADGADFDRFVGALVSDGLTQAGLIALAKAAITHMEDSAIVEVLL